MRHRSRWPVISLSVVSEISKGPARRSHSLFFIRIPIEITMKRPPYAKTAAAATSKSRAAQMTARLWKTVSMKAGSLADGRSVG